MYQLRRSIGAVWSVTHITQNIGEQTYEKKSEMRFLRKLQFWKRRENRKTGVLRGILECLVPCIKQRAINLDNNEETSHRCTAAQYKSVIQAERRQELLDMRQMRQNMWRRWLHNASPHSSQSDSNFDLDMEKDRQGRFYLHDYELIGRVGKGGFGYVLLAKKKATGGHTSKEELFTMKVVQHSHVKKVEKEVLIRAVGHPFLVQFHSYFETKVAACYVMEYLEGGTLDSQLRTMGRFPESVARFYAAEIILAVSFLHKCGIVHRDIKPENILFDRDGHCKLADFGLSRMGIFDRKFATSCCGTRPYIAPEIERGYPYGCEVDWWSVGLVMYEMMVAKYKRLIFRHPTQYPIGLSRNAESVLRMFLANDPRRRLGARGHTRSILIHPFFKKLDWEAVFEKRVTPPVKPGFREFMTSHPEAPGDADDGGRNPSYEAADRRVVLERPPHKLQTEKKTRLEVDVPVEPEDLVEPEAPVETEAPVELDAPEEAYTPFEPDSPVDTEADMEPDALVELDTPVEPDSPVDTEAQMEPDAPVEPGALPEHMKREISSLKEDAEQLRKLLKEKERERMQIKCVAGVLFIGLVLVLAMKVWEMTYT